MGTPATADLSAAASDGKGVDKKIPLETVWHELEEAVVNSEVVVDSQVRRISMLIQQPVHELNSTTGPNSNVGELTGKAIATALRAYLLSCAKSLPTEPKQYAKLHTSPLGNEQAFALFWKDCTGRDDYHAAYRTVSRNVETTLNTLAEEHGIKLSEPICMMP